MTRLAIYMSTLQASSFSKQETDVVATICRVFIFTEEHHIQLHMVLDKLGVCKVYMGYSFVTKLASCMI